MEFIQWLGNLGQYAAGTVVVFGIIGWLARTSFTSWLAKKLELGKLSKQQQVSEDIEKLKNTLATNLEEGKSRFTRELELEKIRLHGEMSTNIEKLKSDLSLRIEESKIVYSRLHEVRMEVIAQFYSNLSDCLNDAALALTFIETGAMGERKERYRTFLNSMYEFRKYFGRKRIFFSKQTADLIDSFVQAMNEITAQFEVFVLDSDDGYNREKGRAWHDSWDKLTSTKIPGIQEAIEKEFRDLLGVESNI